jgi:tRNA threonylcarbamoyl adenosine modification protein YeaZ
MKMLALEFSSAHRSAAVAEVARGNVQILGTGTAENTRAVTGLELIDSALQRSRFSPKDIDVIAIGLGPGSYVGIRSAIALAQGWQLAREVRLVGVSTVELIAAAAQANGIYGEVTIVIDAQRNEVYAAKYEVSATVLRIIEPLQIRARTQIPPGKIVGPEASRLIAGATDLYPTAAFLAGVAADPTEYQRGEELEPIYLRESSFVKAPPARFPGAA